MYTNFLGGAFRLFLLFLSRIQCVLLFLLNVCIRSNFYSSVSAVPAPIAEVSPCFSLQCQLSSEGAGSGGEGLRLAGGGAGASAARSARFTCACDAHLPNAAGISGEEPTVVLICLRGSTTVELQSMLSFFPSSFLVQLPLRRLFSLKWLKFTTGTTECQWLVSCLSESDFPSDLSRQISPVNNPYLVPTTYLRTTSADTCTNTANIFTSSVFSYLLHLIYSISAWHSWCSVTSLRNTFRGVAAFVITVSHLVFHLILLSVLTCSCIRLNENPHSVCAMPRGRLSSRQSPRAQWWKTAFIRGPFTKRCAIKSYWSHKDTHNTYNFLFEVFVWRWLPDFLVCGQ